MTDPKPTPLAAPALPPGVERLAAEARAFTAVFDACRAAGLSEAGARRRAAELLRPALDYDPVAVYGSAPRPSGELGASSPQEFIAEWLSGSLGLPLCAADKDELYSVFARWCLLRGARPLSRDKALGLMARDPGVVHHAARILVGSVAQKRLVIMPAGTALRGRDAATAQIAEFRASARAWLLLNPEPEDAAHAAQGAPHAAESTAAHHAEARP
jgi:hypothetical protein